MFLASRRFAIVPIAMSLAWQAHAQSQETAGDLLASCVPAVNLADGKDLSELDTAQAMWCIGYISGLMDGQVFATQIRNVAALYCAPASGISNDQAVRIVVKHLKANPEKLHESSRLQALVALGKAFPCK